MALTTPLPAWTSCLNHHSSGLETRDLLLNACSAALPDPIPLFVSCGGAGRQVESRDAEMMILELCG